MVRSPKSPNRPGQAPSARRRELIARLADLHPEFQRRLDSAMPAPVHRMRADLRELMAGTTVRQLEVVRTLAVHGALAMHDLAHLQGTTPSSVTELVDRLEERGLVERRHSAEDHRSVVAALTPQAEALVAQVRRIHRARIAVVADAYDDQELATLVRLMEKLTRQLPAGGHRGAETAAQATRSGPG